MKQNSETVFQVRLFPSQRVTKFRETKDIRSHADIEDILRKQSGQDDFVRMEYNG